MKTLIAETISSMFKEVTNRFEEKIEEQLEKRIDGKLKDKMAEIHSRLDLLVYENVQLREDNDKLRDRINSNEKWAQTAMENSNRNEQYSRKNNIKIMGIEEEADETEERLIGKVNGILDTKTGITLNENKIMAIHRIPGKSGMPKPILVKLMNNNEKTKLMKKRKSMKLAGYRLVDDVTKENTKLINRLNLHKDIDSAWYFNGNVFAKTRIGKRFKFDLYTVVEDVIKKGASGATTTEGASRR